MTVAIFNETFVGISELKLQRISDGFIYNLPIPATFAVQDNKQQMIQRTKSSQGRTVRSGAYIKGEEPLLTVDYNYMQPELIAMRAGNTFEEATYNIEIVRTVTVSQSTYPGAATGFLGHGMPADQADSRGAIREAGGLSVQLTQANYSTDISTTTNTFAQGQHGALKFSPDLMGQVVSLIMPHSVTGLGLGDGLIGEHKLVAHLSDTQNMVWVFTASNITISSDGSGFTPDAETLQLPFFLNILPGGCRTWNLYSTNQKVKC